MADELVAEQVTISESAAKRITEIVAKEPSGTMLRIAVLGGGCSGFQYEFKLDMERNPDDQLFVRDDATVVIDDMSLEYMTGSEIDFVNDLIGQAFKINNPLAESACGCGTSFSI